MQDPMMKKNSGAHNRSGLWGFALDRAGTQAATVLALVLAAGCSSQPQDEGAIKIDHAVQSPIAMAEVVDDKGETLRSVPFSCAPGASCELTLPREVLAKTTALRFRDSRGRLVGAYPNANLPNIGYAVTVDANMMGIELFNRLVAQGNYTADSLVHLADEHIYAEFPAGERPSLFADLQAHYQRRLEDPTYNERKYVEDVLKAISSRTGAEARPAASPTPKKVALEATTPGTCDTKTKNLNRYLGAIGKNLAGSMKIPLLSGLIEGATNSIADACASATTKEIISKLDAIQASVDQISTTLTALGVNVRQLAADLAFTNFQNDYANFSNELNLINTRTNTYKALLRGSKSSSAASGYSPPSYPDLSSYIKSNGGLSAATYDSDSSLKMLLGDLSGAINSYNRLVSVNSASAMTTSLYTLCRTSSTIIGDIIERRNLCSLRALRVITQASVAAAELSIVIGDVLLAINKEYSDAETANDSAKLKWLRENLPNNLDPNSNWGQTRTTVLTDMVTNLDLLVGEMSKSVFTDPFSGATMAAVSTDDQPADGLPATLLSNLLKAGCTKSVKGAPVVGIENWVIPKSSATTVVAQPSYINVQCKGRNDEIVYSRFHYEKDVGKDNTVLNVLGVLIDPAAVSRSWGTDQVAVPGEMIQATNTGYYQEKVCLDGGDGRCDWWMVVPGTWGTGPGSFTQVRTHTASISLLSVLFGGNTQRVAVNETALYFAPVNDRILHPVNSPMGRLAGYQAGAKSQYLWGSMWTKSVFNDMIIEGYLVYTWITDTAGWAAKPDKRYTRTVAMRIGTVRSDDSNKYVRTYFMAQCVTNDCNRTVPSQQEGITLTYSDGPRIQWNFFMGEWGAWHMFVNGRASDERVFPERR